MQTNDFIQAKIKVKYLSTFKKNNYFHEIFTIDKKGNTIFHHHQNLVKFDFKKEDLCTKIRMLLNINIKNQQCYELITTIIKLQKKYILSNNRQDLKYFSHKDILACHKKYFNTALVSSNISTISHNSFYRDRNNNIFKLNYMLPKRYFIIYIHIKYLINKYENLTDTKLSYYLKEEFNIFANKTKIYEVRKKYMIPNKENRIKNLYLEYEKNYTDSYYLALVNIQKLENITAIYELVSIKNHSYPYKSTTTVYIGSTNNLKRRLNQYITNRGHTQKLRDFIIRNEIYFRFIKMDNYRELEKDILDAFYTTCGEYPILNHNRIL